MYKTHNCGELRISHDGNTVILSGWVHRVRSLGAMTFLDLRDRFGKTQLVFDEAIDKDLLAKAADLGREFVIRIEGVVRERSSKNDKIPTGYVEVVVQRLDILNPSEVPPFTIEDDTDGGEELRMQYRYLDIRRGSVQSKLLFRSKVAQAVRQLLSAQNFTEVETPVLVKSTPEGARDFVVPSRLNQGSFYALPQSPQTFKQLLMVGGLDRYFQIVKCFRDEDLRADRQPEFTQIDCELSFVDRDDILEIFEAFTKTLFSSVLDIQLEDFQRMPYEEAIEKYGSDKPDLRFDMPIHEMKSLLPQGGLSILDLAESIGALLVKGGNDYTRKQIDALTDWVKRPQIGAKGLIYVRCSDDGSTKSSVDKFYNEEAREAIKAGLGGEPGDLILIMAGDYGVVRKQLGALRIHLGEQRGLVDPSVFKPLWVVDFPLLEWDEEAGRFFSMHHPFTTPSPSSLDHLESTDQKTLENLTADAYDLVINGVEIGGGSIRIAQRPLQERVFRLLGFTDEEAQDQFGFLLNAFRYGAPPHGGIALGFDRLVALMDGSNSIRDYIAFPKNNQARDVMLDAPSRIDKEACATLGISVHETEE